MFMNNNVYCDTSLENESHATGWVDVERPHKSCLDKYLYPTLRFAQRNETDQIKLNKLSMFLHLFTVEMRAFTCRLS